MTYPRDIPDTHLVLGLRAGDTRARERLYAQHHASVYNLCARILCDREEAQDVFIKAFSRPPAADERLNLRAWLYRVATNACYSAIRARRTGGGGQDAIEAVPATVDEYERAQTAALVERSLGELNERYRTALVLKDLQGLPPSDIAAVLQVSRPTADVLVHRARASFRAVFSRLAGGEAAAPASLGLVLAPLGVPAALRAMPPLAAPPLPDPSAALPDPSTLAGPSTALPDPTAAFPDPSTLAGPGAAGLLSRLGEAVAAKAAATAAAATLLVGGGLAVQQARHDARQVPAADAAVRVDDAHSVEGSDVGLHHGADQHRRWSGHERMAEAHARDHAGDGHDTGGHETEVHTGSNHETGTSAHDADAAASHDTGGSDSGTGDRSTDVGAARETHGAGDGDAAHE